MCTIIHVYVGIYFLCVATQCLTNKSVHILHTKRYFTSYLNHIWIAGTMITGRPSRNSNFSWIFTHWHPINYWRMVSRLHSSPPAAAWCSPGPSDTESCPALSPLAWRYLALVDPSYQASLSHLQLLSLMAFKGILAFQEPSGYHPLVPILSHSNAAGSVEEELRSFLQATNKTTKKNL